MISTYSPMTTEKAEILSPGVVRRLAGTWRGSAQRMRPRECPGGCGAGGSP
ncbi:hypothetical protein ES332_D08G064200v1 [Gossypium tomentosum]|uniref:Uncharacterized protein n=1 Tax=Gossypium tomentosum TaxID=34277 RepID=A0A5D2JQI8_GOSTO|nr:hypothetical protein ES332_D08G064200v1 [Gossypium tomentosum]